MTTETTLSLWILKRSLTFVEEQLGPAGEVVEETPATFRGRWFHVRHGGAELLADMAERRHKFIALDHGGPGCPATFRVNWGAGRFSVLADLSTELPLIRALPGGEACSRDEAYARQYVQAVRSFRALAEGLPC